MQNQMAQTVRIGFLFGCTLFLTCFLILFEVSFFIQCNQAYLSGFSEVSQQLKIPVSVLPEMGFFILAQLAVHLIFCTLVWVCVLGLIYLFELTDGLYLSIFIWLLFITTAFLGNQIYYPNSKFAELTAYVLPYSYYPEFLLALTLTLCCLTILLSSLGYLKKNKIIFYFMLGTAFIFVLVSHEPELTKRPSLSQPHIFIIGVDSLRPDFLGFYGAHYPTPKLDKFLSRATVFVDAVTPLARTFPSWATILSGRHPAKLGIRSNLAAQDHLNLSQTLPAILKQQGYLTIYATDESRFSNIDRNFGFNTIVSPRMGINDFLLGSLNDFPLSNLLVNTSLGESLFPYSYANRGVFFTYRPSSFLKRLMNTLGQTPSTQPLFMAVHFCLPHFPYTWDRYASARDSVIKRYQTSILAADNQIGKFLSLLKHYGYLSNAIVILLSDHGEAIELHGDRVTSGDLYQDKGAPLKFYPPALEKEDFDQSAGHGTDVLGLKQYQTLLALRTYGGYLQVPGKIIGAVSLQQLMPTILDVLNIPSPIHPEASLKKYLTETSAQVSEHSIYLESDFSPESIRTVYPQLSKVMLEGIQLFQIDQNNGRLVLKQDMERMVIRSKQYANLQGEWILALYPVDRDQRLPVLVNLRTGMWTTKLDSAFAKMSPAKKMLRDLQQFYTGEVTNVAQKYSHPSSRLLTKTQ